MSENIVHHYEALERQINDLADLEKKRNPNLDFSDCNNLVLLLDSVIDAMESRPNEYRTENVYIKGVFVNCSDTGHFAGFEASGAVGSLMSVNENIAVDSIKQWCKILEVDNFCLAIGKPLRIIIKDNICIGIKHFYRDDLVWYKNEQNI